MSPNSPDSFFSEPDNDSPPPVGSKGFGTLKEEVKQGAGFSEPLEEDAEQPVPAKSGRKETGQPKGES